MHGLFFAALVALTNSIDNLGAWIAFNMNGIRITMKVNLWLAVITLVLSTGSALVGRSLLGVLDARVCGWISAAVFVSMGVWFIAEPAMKRRRAGRGNVIINILEHPEQADLNDSKDIDFKEAALLGLALSLNNIGGSFSAGMIGLNPWVTGALSAVFSFCALWVGRWITGVLLRLGLGDKAPLFSGAILILLGIRQIF